MGLVLKTLKEIFQIDFVSPVGANSDTPPSAIYLAKAYEEKIVFFLEKIA